MTVSSQAVAAALLSTGFISLAPNIILLLFPGYAASQDNSLMLLGQTLAAGGLLGDVFLHTIPHAMEDAAHHHHHHPKEGTEAHPEENNNTVGIMILVGFVIFLTADLLMRSLQGEGHGHSHSHSHSISHTHGSENGESSCNQQHEKKQTTPTIKTSTILLNLAADALHNFTDGLAIGTSYAVQQNHQNIAEASPFSMLFGRGGLATVSILFHEIPHELGDFCVLIRAGYTKRQAVLAQFTTAIAAFMGTLVALYFSHSGIAGGEEGLMFITAGGFVYLAAVTILPDALEHEASSLWFRLAQLLSFCSGIGFMYIVTFLEETEGDHSHHHSHASDHDSIQQEL